MRSVIFSVIFRGVHPQHPDAQHNACGNVSRVRYRAEIPPYAAESLLVDPNNLTSSRWCCTTASSSTISAWSASRAGEHQPILRLAYMRFARALVSHWADPTLFSVTSLLFWQILVS